MSPRGTFFVFEGIDRCGKSTQSIKLADYLKSKQIPVELWRFPDRTSESGKRINQYLEKTINLSDEDIHLLFVQNRWEKRQELLDKLALGVSLVVDRYAFSGAAYSAAKKNPTMTLEWCRGPDLGLPAPDRLFYLQVSPETARTRGGYGGERYEVLSFQEEVLGMYERQRDASWTALDASRSVEDIHQQIAAEADLAMALVGGGAPLRRLDGQLETDLPSQPS